MPKSKWVIAELSPHNRDMGGRSREKFNIYNRKINKPMAIVPQRRCLRALDEVNARRVAILPELLNEINDLLVKNGNGDSLKDTIENIRDIVETIENKRYCANCATLLSSKTVRKVDPEDEADYCDECCGKILGENGLGVDEVDKKP